MTGLFATAAPALGADNGGTAIIAFRTDKDIQVLLPSLQRLIEGTSG